MIIFIIEAISIGNAFEQQFDIKHDRSLNATLHDPKLIRPLEFTLDVTRYHCKLKTVSKAV